MDRNQPEAPGQIELSKGQERAAALVAVLRDQAEKEGTALRAQTTMRRRNRRGNVALAVSAFMAAWVWIFPPDAIRIKRPSQPTVAEEAASLRRAMFLQNSAIQQYRIENGHIPDGLEAAGPAFDGMEYIHLTRREYRLRGRSERVTLSYSSTESIEDFVGEDLDLIENVIR
ncbi:MAG: hypothetical protein BMS9Abin29_0281 [Gemmatimonadota bacterium]|nr:MAG: hypothetical protein BMS9Abin29_0281 [Gemmatimonadota bacterium]